jgi:transcriptional regulator with XRE-family HTH domain
MASPNKDILKIFGQNLKKIRTQKGLSQRQLSALCNVDNADISRMENGEMNVTLNTIAQLADALEISFFKLVKPE